MRRLWYLFACLAIAAAAPASAVPNYLGQTGLILIPTGDVLDERALEAHLQGTDDFVTFGAMFGIMNRVEIGVTALDIDDDTFFTDRGNTRILANAKVSLLRERLALPAVAVGVVDAFDQLDRDPSWYVVASKGIIAPTPTGLRGVRAHLGYGGGLYENQLFGGLETTIFPRITGIAEIAGGDVNLGARVDIIQGLRANVSLLDFDSFGAGVSYRYKF